MKRRLSTFPLFLSLLLLGTNTIEAIKWENDYKTALNQARQNKLPIALFFTGSDWCSWCTKMEKEILDTAEFDKQIENKIIFVKVDFPAKQSLEAKQLGQNGMLQEKYRVKSFPTLVLIDKEERPIGTTGFKEGGGRSYAAHLLKIVDDYQSYRGQMDKLKVGTLPGKELKRLYQKAHELSQNEDMQSLIEKGSLSEQALFFQTEKYRLLVEEGKRHDQDCVKLKQKILEMDHANKNMSHYQIAVIDFEDCCQDKDKTGIPTELTVAPLTDYLERFGDKDNENRWRLNMIISQSYLDKGRFKEALDYAQKAHQSAPSSIQGDIAMAIENIKRSTHSR